MNEKERRSWYERAKRVGFEATKVKIQLSFIGVMNGCLYQQQANTEAELRLFEGTTEKEDERSKENLFRAYEDLDRRLWDIAKKAIVEKERELEDLLEVKTLDQCSINDILLAIAYGGMKEEELKIIAKSGLEGLMKFQQEQEERKEQK